MMNYTIPPFTQANRKNADVVWMPAYGRFLSVPTGRYIGSIVLKKSASVSTAEKYAPEIEICVFRKRFRTRISRSNVQKRYFHPSVFERFGQTDFFNRIGQKPPLKHVQQTERNSVYR